MVEESTDLLEVPEENDQESRIIAQIPTEISASANVFPRRASIDSCQAASSSTKNSAENPNSAKTSHDVVPHYLRRSAGSCHDLCKFGRKGPIEEEARARAMRKRNVKLLPKELIPVQIFVPDEKTKEKVVNHKPPIETQRSLHLKPTPDGTKPDSTKRRTLLEKAKVVKNKPSADVKNLSGGFPSCETKSYQRRTRTSSDKEASPRQSITRLSKSKPLSNKKLPSPDPPEIIKNVCFSPEKAEGSSTGSKVQRSEEKIAVLSKKLILVKVKPDARGKEQRNCDAGTGKNLAAFKATPKKVVSPKLPPIKIAPIKLKKDGSLKLASPLKDQNRVRPPKTGASRDEKVSEKTLHVIKTEADNNVFEAIPNDHADEALSDAKPSSSAANKDDGGEIDHSDVEMEKIVPDSHESPEIVSILPPEENHTKTPRKSRTAVSEAKPGSPMKIKFKTGKVIDLKSDNYSPRRLRFRRARVHGAEDSKVSSGRTLKKGVSNDNAAAAHASKSSVKFVLKHQDVQDKKDAQGLFNNVIEETASKLAETRKSKVKALVGAFETVISLQDTKPSP